MKLVTDDRCRVESPELFKPNTPYQANRTSDGRIEFIELVEKEVPVVQVRRVKGKLIPQWPKGFKRPTREEIAAAVRADRDAR